MQDIINLLKTVSTGELSLAVALIAICCLLVSYFYKEIKALYKEHYQQIKIEREESLNRYDQIYLKYKDDNDKIVKQMFETLNKNTEANTRLAEAMRDLSGKI